MKIYEGGNEFKNDDGTSQTKPISQAELKPTLEYVSQRIGLPMNSEVNSSGKITRYGIEDSLLGSAAKGIDGMLGRKVTMGDIDIAVDEGRFGFDELLSKLVQKLGSENVGKPMAGLKTIPTKVPVNGNEDGSDGYVQVDFMVGDPKLLTFTYKSPDIRAGKSEHSGTYRNILMVSILQNMRRLIRDPETQDVLAQVGPALLLNKGIVNQWRHFPLRKDNNGRLKTMKSISKDDFDAEYPGQGGKEKEMTLSGPEDIIQFVFPNSTLTPNDIDSFEELRDAIIKHMPDQAENIFNRAIGDLHKRHMEIPKGLVVESLKKIETQKLLNEVRSYSMDLVTESIVKVNEFPEFRKACINLIQMHKKTDHFTKPLVNADIFPQDGYIYLINKCGMAREWSDVCKTHKHDSDIHTEAQCEFFKEFCDLIQQDEFFHVIVHYKLQITPESFVNGLIDLEPLEECM